MTIHSNRSYLQKHRFAERQITNPPSEQLGIVIVIPSYCESNMLDTLNSLEACSVPQQRVEVIIIINSGVHEQEAVQILNKRTLEEVESWIQDHETSSIAYYVLHFPHLPRKQAGVGLARKIGMDEAVDRFEQAGQVDGVIVCLDADTTVASNYLVEIERHFSKYPQIQACSIYFEHPLAGETYEAEIYEGIIRYELFLRYYIQALRFAAYPYAFHTIGSAMAVRSGAYQSQGGMNRRKAGEDFYFLQKFIQLAKLNELNTTTVYPSPRSAEKVPFGTGRAIQQWLAQEEKEYLVYALNSFQDLRKFLTIVPDLYEQDIHEYPDSIGAFLRQEEFFNQHLPELRKHVSSQQAFNKRFFRWFDGLKVLKFIHFARDHYYPNEDIEVVAYQLYALCHDDNPPAYPLKKLLLIYRDWQR